MFHLGYLKMNVMFFISLISYSYYSLLCPCTDWKALAKTWREAWAQWDILWFLLWCRSGMPLCLESLKLILTSHVWFVAINQMAWILMSDLWSMDMVSASKLQTINCGHLLLLFLGYACLQYFMGHRFVLAEQVFSRKQVF